MAVATKTAPVTTYYTIFNEAARKELGGVVYQAHTGFESDEAITEIAQAGVQNIEANTTA